MAYNVTGILDSPRPKVEANAAVAVGSPTSWSYDSFLASCTRNEAMSVPSVARARNVIAGTIGTLPLWAYNSVTGERLYGRDLLKQADPGVAMGVTVAWTVEDLLMHGIAYWQILETDSISQRPIHARRIAPERVMTNIDDTTQTMTGFYIDGRTVPMYGIGSLIVFNGFDDGILARGGRTIRTALNLERAASNMANEPVPAQILQNNGVDLPSDKVAELLNTYKASRRNSSVAYLGSALKIEPVGFDAASLQLVESRQHTATEIARLCSIPAWYLNADVAGMTYSNVTQERRSLIDFSLRPYLAAIEQRLSMDDCTARGTVVRFSLDNYLRGNPMEQLDVVTKMLDYNLVDIPTAQSMLDLVPNGGTV